MKISKFSTFIAALILLQSCASGYHPIDPKRINYISNNAKDGVSLSYKYDLLDKRYAKRETKNGVKLVAVKLTNNSEKNLVFGKDIKLTYENGNELYIMDNDAVFKQVKQGVPVYLLYLLLTPLNLYTTKTNSSGFTEQTSSTPIGLIVGPGLSVGNMVAAGSANKKFKSDLLEYNITGTTIKPGETIHGLMGIKSNSYDAIHLKVERANEPINGKGVEVH